MAQTERVARSFWEISESEPKAKLEVSEQNILIKTTSDWQAYGADRACCEVVLGD